MQASFVQGLQPGSRISFQHAESNATLPYVFIVENAKKLLPDGTPLFHFGMDSNSEEHLRVIDGGRVDLKGGRGPYATWKVEVDPSDTTGGAWLQCVAFLEMPNIAGQKGWALGFNPITKSVIGNAAKDSAAKFRFVSAAPKAPPRTFVDPLTADQKRQFVEKGFLILRNAVPQPVVDEALRIINYGLGNGQFEQSGGKMEFADLVRASPALNNLLYESTLYDAAASLFGGEKNIFPRGAPRKCQVALRFPQPQPQPPNFTEQLGWHIDGMEKVYDGENHPFVLLCGVALSSQTKPYCGNLRIFPGSHIAMQEPYRRALISRSPVDLKTITVGPTEHVLLEPGDVVLCHQMLAHGVGLNFSPHIRYQVYFRLSHREHERLRPMMLNDMWAEFEGLKEYTSSLPKMTSSLDPLPSSSVPTISANIVKPAPPSHTMTSSVPVMTSSQGGAPSMMTSSVPYPIDDSPILSTSNSNANFGQVPPPNFNRGFAKPQQGAFLPNALQGNGPLMRKFMDMRMGQQQHPLQQNSFPPQPPAFFTPPNTVHQNPSASSPSSTITYYYPNGNNSNGM